MSENDEQNSRRRAAVWIALGVLIPVFYVLSIGPVCWLLIRFGGRLSNPAVSVLSCFYWPVEWAGDNWSWFGGFLLWYINLFQ